MEAEADEIVTQTLLGIGIDLGATMADAPTAAPRGLRPVLAAADTDANARAAADLDARFSALNSMPVSLP